MSLLSLDKVNVFITSLRLKTYKPALLIKNKKEKRFILVWLIVLLHIPSFADDANILKSRLNQINSFHAVVTQHIIGSKGNIIQESKGELWMKRPSQFHWHMIEPDEIILISDGKTLWVYNPCIEQVTASWLENVAYDTPFILIIRNIADEWQQYNVKKHGDVFSLVPKTENNYLKQFTIKITNNGTISSFTAVEQNGQCNIFYVKHQKNGEVEDSKFHFMLPRGVTLDDQRQ